MFLNSLRNIFCFMRRKFCFRNSASTGGQTLNYVGKHQRSQMFPQQCFLVCSGPKGGTSGRYVLKVVNELSFRKRKFSQKACDDFTFIDKEHFYSCVTGFASLLYFRLHHSNEAAGLTIDNT